MGSITNFANQNLIVKNPPKNLFKILFFILLILFLIVIIFLITLLAAKTQNPISNQVNPTPTVVNKISDWKTYNFPYSDTSIKYPSNWIVKNINNSVCLSDISSIYPFCEIEITKGSFSDFFSSEEGKSFEDTMAENIKESTSDDYTKKIIINNINAYEFQSSYPSYNIYLKNNDNIYKMNFNPNTPDKDSLEWKIVNTFSFN